MPGITRCVSRVNFPTTELLVQPPAIIAVAHFEVGEPFGYDRYKTCVHSNADAYHRSSQSRQLRNHEFKESRERTDETDDKPALPSHSDLSKLRPQPTKRQSTARVIVCRMHRVIETYPPVPLDNGILYPVCQTRRRGGRIRFQDISTICPKEEPTYRREAFITSASSR